MNLLLDTPVLLWALGSPEDLRQTAQQAIVAPENEVFVSAVTAWEIAIKSAIGKLEAPSDLERQLDHHRFRPLDVSVRHASALRGLPMIHRDPFDRMLIAQAQTEGLVIATRDRIIPSYRVSTLAA